MIKLNDQSSRASFFTPEKALPFSQIVRNRQHIIFALSAPFASKGGTKSKAWLYNFLQPRFPYSFQEHFFPWLTRTHLSGLSSGAISTREPSLKSPPAQSWAKGPSSTRTPTTPIRKYPEDLTASPPPNCPHLSHLGLPRLLKGTKLPSTAVQIFIRSYLGNFFS